MTALLVAAAVIAGTGAIAALAPIDARLGLIGLTASLVGAAVIADPLPSPTVLAIRLTAILLAVVTLRSASALITPGSASARGWAGSTDRWADRSPARPAPGARIGWPAEALFGIAGAAAGLAIASRLAVAAHAGGAVGQAPALASTDLLSPAGLGLAVAGLMLAVGLAPALAGDTGLRRAVAAVLLVDAAVLARVVLAPAPGVLEEVLLGGLLVAVAAGGTMLAAAEHRAPPHGPRTVAEPVAPGVAPSARRPAATDRRLG